MSENFYDYTSEELYQMFHSFVLFFLFLTFFSIIALIVIVSALIIISKIKRKEKESRAYLSHIIKAQEEERARIATELNDTLAQDLRGATALSTDEKLKSVLFGCISSVRTMSHILAPPNMSAESLSDLLRSLCLRLKSETDMDVSCVIREAAALFIDSKNISPSDKLSISRIVQEALNNVKQHSKATEVSVIVRCNIDVGERNGLYISIIDNGIGIAHSRASTVEHFGISGMKLRSSLLGGSLNIKSGKGTEIRLFIPMEKFS